jgi:hypothetical protein
MIWSTRKHPYLLNDKGMRRLCIAVVTRALTDLMDTNASNAADAREWIFSEYAEATCDGAGYYLPDIQWHVRRMIRQGTLKKAA